MNKKLQLALLLVILLAVSGGAYLVFNYSNKVPNQSPAPSAITPEPRSVTYLVSKEDSTKYCNGADMDSAGYQKTITTPESTSTAELNPTNVQIIKTIINAATTGMCRSVMSQLDITENNGTVYIPPIDAWAGVSIVMCSCKPQVEVNILQIPGLTKVVWLAAENTGNESQKADLIRLETPRPNETISSPLTIKGQARGSWFFEASFPIFLYDGNGQKIATAIAQAKADWMTEDFVPFEATLKVPVADTAAGVLVFKKDNPSGLPENDDELRMPIKFSSDTRQISLYFYNQIRDKEIADYIPCSPDAVLPVTRKIFLSQTPIQDAINLLLQGNITPAEKDAGFLSEFPLDGVKLIGANLKDEALTLEFADPLGKTGGGSCRVGLLWNQIAKTAKQFTGVKEVKFSPADLFQP